MLADDSVDRHYWLPKSQGGNTSTYLHRTCHCNLHSLLRDRDLARECAAPEPGCQNPEMLNCIRWVRGQLPERVMKLLKPRHKQ